MRHDVWSWHTARDSGAREVEQESYISSTDSVHDSVIRQLSDCTMRQVVEVWRLSFCDSLNMLFRCIRKLVLCHNEHHHVVTAFYV